MSGERDIPRCLSCGGAIPYHHPTCTWKGYIETPLTERQMSALRRRAGIPKSDPENTTEGYCTSEG